MLSLLERLGVFSSTVGQYIESALPKRPPEGEESLTQELPPPKEAPFSEAPPQKDPPPTKKLPPKVKQRPGVIWNKTLLLPQAPFEIETDYGTDYYIKLVDAETNDDAMAIYVVGGQDLEVLVPLGYYKMRYAYGETWRGEQHLFGPGDLTTVEEALENFDFNRSFKGFSGYTVRLIPHITGNLPTRHIARDDF